MWNPEQEQPFAPRTQLALVQLVVGEKALEQEAALTRYRSMRDIEHFFEVLNISISNPKNEGRGNLVRRIVKGLDRATFAKVCEQVVAPPEFAGAGDVSHAAAAAHLNTFLQSDGAELVFDGRRYALRELGERRRVAVPIAPASILSDAYVIEQLDKCEAKLTDADYDGAITNARTLIEAVLFELQKRLIDGGRDDHGGDLPKLYKQVSKAMNLDDTRKDIDDHFKGVVRGLVTIVGGLAPISNRTSDRHAREKAPEPHHARAVVNAAKTVVVFLVESYHWQASRGRFKGEAQ